jgi:hypothetical protein
VTLGDYRRPLQISQFIKDVHAGFQILNLKNDTLRKRSDGIKYRVKDVEDVVLVHQWSEGRFDLKRYMANARETC